MTVNKKKTSNLSLSKCLSGKLFDAVLKAAEHLCESKTDATGRGIFRKPSLGNKLGHSLLKCARLKKREAIKREDSKSEKEADKFIALYTSDWADFISSRFLMTLKLKKLQGPEVLPQAEDLVKLKDHIDLTISHLTKKLKKFFTYPEYRKLLEYTLAALILFNKRRGGEASKLLLETYMNRRKWSRDSNQEIINSLTDMEKKLVERLTLGFNLVRLLIVESW